MAIGVIVEEKIKEGQLAAFVEYMAEMIALTKEEEGCRAYDLYESTDGSGSVVMMEIWDSMETLEAHMASEHFKKFIPGAEAYKAETSEIRIFERL